MMDDWDLLQEYAGRHSEAAFAELVQRHLNWVYSVARRNVHDPHLASDVTQSVFVLLARKAPTLRRGVILTGWLFRTTRFVALQAGRNESRRRRREQMVSAMMPTNPSDDNERIWQQVSEYLDRAVASLSEKDRAAVLLRFYEARPLRDVGHQLGISEDAAKKRISRAVERMRRFLLGRGVGVAGTGLVALLSDKTVEAAPAALGPSVLSTVRSAASASGSVLQLVRQILKARRLLAWKAAGAVAVLSVATGLIAMRIASRSEPPAPTPAVGNVGSSTQQVEVVVPPEPATNLVAAPTVTNAAVLYQQAFALYDALADDEKDLIVRGHTSDASVVAELCGKIQPICDLMRQATAVSNCDWGVEQPIRVLTLYPYLTPCRNLSRTAVWSVAHCRTNDPSAAVDDLIATSRLGQHASSPTTLIGCLVDMAIHNVVASCVSENASRLTGTDCTQLMDRLANANYDELLCRAIETESDIHTRRAEALAAMPPEQALAELLKASDDSYASQIRSIGTAQAIANYRQMAQLEGEFAQALAMPDAEYDAWLARRDQAGIANPLVAQGVTSLEKAVDKAQCTRVNSAMAAAGLAVMQDGPDALASYPDPATGQPFTYTQTDDGFTLESGFQSQGKTLKLSFR